MASVTPSQPRLPVNRGVDYVFKVGPGQSNRTAKATQKPIEFLRPSPHHARTPGKGQFEAVEASLQRYGQVSPILCKSDGEIIDGHTTYQAAKKLGFASVLVIIVDHLNDAEIRALRLSLNKTAERGLWDPEKLKLEFDFLFEFDADLTNFTGFETPDIDSIMNVGVPRSSDTDYGDVFDGPVQPVSEPGDTWLCAEQKFTCGSAADPACYRKLLGTERTALMATDPPYGCKVAGHVSRTHQEFVEGSGFDEPMMIRFLSDFASTAREFLAPGALSYVFMDAAGMYAAQTALRQSDFRQKALLVWDKQVGGMGSFYRQQAEFILVTKYGKGAHANNIRLGVHGRNRTTVMSYPGLSQFGSNRAELLAMHPTIKPIGLIADLILDASRRNDVVLDPFLGSGTTLIAAHRVGRRGRGIELDPKYVDVAVQRLQTHTGQPALHATTGLTFDEMAKQRAEERAKAAESPTPAPRVRTRLMRPHA